jgi:urease accessory protein
MASEPPPPGVGSPGSETVPPPSPPARVGRDGRLDLRFERRAGRTVVTECRYTLPLQVMAPIAVDDAAAVVSILNPTGGLVGGDRLHVDIHVGAGAHACLTTPSATKVYRAAAEAALQTVRITAAAGATVEWMPDHTIPFPGAALRQAIDVDLAEGARLLLVDAFSAGRVTRGEAWRFARLESGLEIRDGRGRLFTDRWVLAGGEAWDGLGFTEGRPYFATMVIVADSGLDRFHAEVDAAFAGREEVEVAVGTLRRRGRVVRCLAADAPALVQSVQSLWSLARGTVLGLPALGLRKG